MMRKAGELYRLRRSVGAACKGYAQDFRGRDGIVRESFVKVAHAEKQYCIGMLGFHLGVLLHQRSFHVFLCHL